MTLAGRPLLLESQSVRTTWDGRPAFQVFLRDHSERRRAEAALRHQANLLASVSDAVVAILEFFRTSSSTKMGQSTRKASANASEGRESILTMRPSRSNQITA